MSEPSSKSRHFYLALLLGVTVLIYAQVLRFGLISGWDDKLYFMSHSLLEGWPEASWRDRLLTPELGYPSPLPTAIYFVLHRLPEATAVALAHGINLIFHLINVCLAFAVARRFLPRLSQAFGATLIWAVHPVLAESVAWITNLKSLGMATAVLAAIWVWDRYLQEPSPRWLVAAAACLVLGLAFKPPAIVIAPLLVGMTIIVRPRLLRKPSVLGLFSIMAVVSGVYLWIARALHHDLIADDGFAASATGFGETLERIGGAFYLQLRNLVAPLDLHPIYFSDQVTAVQSGLGGMLFVGLLAASLWAFLKKQRAIALSLLVFWANYLPYSGLEYLPRFTADTYLYLPLLGLAIAFVGLGDMLEALTAKRWARTGRIAGIAMVVAFGLLSILQTARWSDSASLWKPLLAAQPEQYVPHFLVGEIYFSAEEYEKAARVYAAGLEHFDDVAGNRAMPLAVALERAGHLEAARNHMIRVLSEEFPHTHEAESYALYLMITYQLPLPEGEGGQMLVDAALAVLERDELAPEHTQQVAQYLREQGRDGVAQRFEDYRR